MKAAERQKLNKDAGFSLLELLIAVVILAIIVIPLLNLFLSSNRLNIKSRQTLRATTAAQDIMEGLKAYNIDEVKAQFADPAGGFYVIDSRVIKGGVAEETALEVDPSSGNPLPGYYVFSMEELNMQGSKFDAKIEIDGTGYMTGTLTHDHEFNGAALADARSIDRDNGTFVETEKLRQAVLRSVFKNSAMETAIKSRLTAAGAADVEKAYADLQDEDESAYVCYKNLTTFFDRVSRTIEVTLSVSAEVDEDGDPKVDMEVTQTYEFTYQDAGGADVTITTAGDSGDPLTPVVDKLPCGSIARIKDDKGVEPDRINVNLFYYPLYGPGLSNPDKIIINNESGAALNLLIAKQRHETTNAAGQPDLSDPEYYADPQLTAAEQSYRAEITVNDLYGFDTEKFTLKTNLGSNLVGEKYLKGEPGVADPKEAAKIPSQLSVNGTGVPAALNQLNIFTLDGVRSPLGKAGAPGEATELIYDVEVSVYEEGAAASGFPDDMRMVVIGGSMTN